MNAPTCCGGLPMTPRETWTHGTIYVCPSCGMFTCQKMNDMGNDLGIKMPKKFPAFLMPPVKHWRQPSLN